MNKNLPIVSVIVPCYNEEKFIGKCLESILNQDYPKKKLEILVVDGISDDKTREIVKNYNKRYPFIKLLDNSKKFTPSAFNVGIKKSEGNIIILMGAHARYEKNYVSKCVKYLEKYKADNVGGILKTVSSENTIIAKIITLSISHPFGTGDSHFKIGSKKPKLVDTVFGGCYKKEIFDKIGFFNENLIRSQDMEFNLRLKRAGGKILLVPDIISYYYPKSNLKDFFIHNFKDGIWAIYPLKFVKIPLKLRHYIPFLFVSSLLGTGLLGIFIPIFFWLFLLILGSYFLVAIYFSIKLGVKEKDIKFSLLMPMVFACRHVGYGLGSIWGLIKLFQPEKRTK